MGLSKTDTNISILRRHLKHRIFNNNELVKNLNESRQVLELLQKTICYGESNSALLVGPRSCGKTTLINAALETLQPHFKTEAVLVKLHGLIHTDDRLALKAVTSQMDLDSAVDGKVFGSFADNLSFLLACLKSGSRGVSKSVIFVLEEFDLFCAHHNQTLLYNLFDVSQSAQTPICVLGVTYRLDVIELLEKRVKSRFSHRQIFLFPTIDFELRVKRLETLLTLNSGDVDLPQTFRKQWNVHVKSFVNAKEFRNLFRQLLDVDLGERTLNNILFMMISELSEEKDKLTCESFKRQIKQYEKDDIVQVLLDLSVLELCLVIAMKHHCEIYDNQPMNFEMVLNRYLRFTNANSHVQSVQRAVVMKAFEHIENLELIAPISTGSHGVQKEYQLYKLLVLPQQIKEAVKKASGLPTEVAQWANSSPI